MTTAVKAGFISGTDSKKPEAACTREKLIAMAMRLYEIKTSEKAASATGGAGIYKDMSQVSSGLLPRIRFAAENGIITSRFSDTLGPKDPVTRAEAMVLLEKLLKYSGEL
jgi:ribosomal protein L35AE/L33A